MALLQDVKVAMPGVGSCPDASETGFWRQTEPAVHSLRHARRDRAELPFDGGWSECPANDRVSAVHTRNRDLPILAGYRYPAPTDPRALPHREYKVISLGFVGDAW